MLSYLNMDIINILTFLAEYINYQFSTLWIVIFIGVVIIAILPVRSIAEKVDEIGSMLEEYEEASRRDLSNYLPTIYRLIDEFYENKLPEPDHFWDARDDVCTPNVGAKPNAEDMINMDYPESQQLRRTPNATNLLYLESSAHRPTVRGSPDMADVLANAISASINNRQAGPPLRRHRQRYQPANIQREDYIPQLITILAPPSRRPPKYYYYMVDRRTLPEDYQPIVPIID